MYQRYEYPHGHEASRIRENEWSKCAERRGTLGLMKKEEDGENGGNYTSISSGGRLLGL